jgi:hypothetical protein
MKTYWFDVLPIHPPPERLESYTGYLTRLAEHNGLMRFTDLADRLFPGTHALKVREFTDYTPSSYGRLLCETTCTEMLLQTTTFFHLARKFGLSPLSYKLRAFMRGALSPHLRYCPHCIAETGFYQLPWRLYPLSGCPQHGCFLLDCCTFCGSAIRLLTVPFRIGRCPHCQADLRQCSAPSLTPDMHTQVQARYLDIAFLLSPQTWETDRPYCPSVAAGDAMKRARRRLEQGVKQVAAHTGMPR